MQSCINIVNTDIYVFDSESVLYHKEKNKNEGNLKKKLLYVSNKECPQCNYKQEEYRM